MRITAVAVGTRGDVNPLAELGSEMVKRGHDFRILAQEDFRTLIEKKNVTYLHLDGDADHVMKYLVTNYRTSLDFLTGLMKLKWENPAFAGKIPYNYIFPKVKAVVHHGGCTTNGLGLWAGCPHRSSQWKV